MGARWPWLLAAALLFAAAAALMWLGDETAPVPPRAEVDFPRRLRPSEQERLERRRVLPVPPPSTPGPGTQAAPPPRPRDPVLAALTSEGKRSAVIIEANAIRNSPLGQLLIDCLTRGKDENPFEEIKQRSGVDLLQDLDRVALMEDRLIFSGHFGQARWPEVLRGRAVSSTYGDLGQIYHFPPRQGRDGGVIPREDVLATWGDQVVFVADNAGQAQDVIDHLEGRAQGGQPPLDESQTYGEIYGVLAAEDLARLFPPDQAALAERLRTAAQQVELHVDTSKDVGIVARVEGADETQVEDLGKSLGAALSLARLKARADGEDSVAELLELARVSPGGARFNLEMALPLEVLEKHLAFCKNAR